MTAAESPKPVSTPPADTRTLEELRKENEYLRAEVAYLKKLDALVRAKQQAAQKKHKL
jgi:transposase